MPTTEAQKRAQESYNKRAGAANAAIKALAQSRGWTWGQTLTHVHILAGQEPPDRSDAERLAVIRAQFDID